MSQATNAAEELRARAVPCRVHVKWLGVRKTLSVDQIAETARSFSAQTKMLGATKSIIDTSDESYRRLTRVRSQLKKHWQDHTLPFPEPGVRLLTRSSVEAFDQNMQGYRHDLQQAAMTLESRYDELKTQARDKLGRLYNLNDYPQELAKTFDVTWDYPNVEPPDYLMHLKPQVYQAECQRVSGMFEAAVAQGERMFAQQLLNLTRDLAAKLEPGEDGRRRVFRDSAVENFREFFEKFRTLAVTDDAELVAVVEQAQEMMEGVTPQKLRTDEELRSEVAGDMDTIVRRLGDMVGIAPRRAVKVARVEPELEVA